MQTEVIMHTNQLPEWALPVASDVFGMRVLIANLYFVGSLNSKNEWVLIDAGVGSCADNIEKAAEELYGTGAKPRAIILTHGHFDHIGGVQELAQRWDVPVYAHELELPFLTGRSDYPPADPGVGGGGMAWLSFLYPRRAIDLGSRVHALPADGSVPFLDGWQTVHTPGHTPGHVSFFRESDRVMIAGDAVVTTKQESTYSAITQTPQEVHNPPAYFTIDWIASKRSVEKIAALRPSMIATGHGVPMGGAEMLKQLEHLAADFEHRGVPQGGRYVQEPALADETGIVKIPPPTVRGQIPKVAAGLILTAALFAVVSILKRGKR